MMRVASQSRGIQCEVIYCPPDWNKYTEKSWTYHWNNNGMEAGFDEYFRTSEEAEIAMGLRMKNLWKGK